MKRSPITRKSWLARKRVQVPPRRTEAARSAPSPQRARKAAEDAEYARTRAQRFVQARGQCEFSSVVSFMRTRCSAPATQTHHIARRSHTGTPDHSVENLRAFCATHHAWVHANIEKARELGYIVTSWPQIEARGG